MVSDIIIQLSVELAVFVEFFSNEQLLSASLVNGNSTIIFYNIFDLDKVVAHNL